jgi:chaperonin GroES
LNIQPLADHVVIKPSEESEEKTKSGLYVPDTAKEKPQEGQVIAVGPGALNDKGELIPMNVAVGDKVIYKKYAG